MRLSTLTAAATLAVSLLTPLTTSLAQDPRLTTTQAEHELLQRMAGEWQFERFMPAQDGSGMQAVGTGTVSAAMIGDYFVVSNWSGSIFGMDFHGLQILGYDIESSRYTGNWVDGFISYRWELIGSAGDAGRELVIETRGPAPAGGTTRFRETYRFVSADSMTVTGEMQDAGAWTTLTVTHLTRMPDHGAGFAAEHLESSRARLLATISDMSDSQWVFRENPDRWSPQEIVEHLALSEDFFYDIIANQVMATERRAEPLPDAAAGDRELLAAISDRSQQFTAPDPLQPNQAFNTPREAVDHFVAARDRTLEFARTTPDLRLHALAMMGGSELDAASWLTFVAAHTYRHTAQLQQVKDDPGFP